MNLQTPSPLTTARLPWAALPWLAALTWLSGACHAGTVQVAVTGQDGKPAANVVVQVMSGVSRPAAAGATPLVIEQRDLQFSPYLSVARTGTTVRFTNRDPYDHHVRSTPGGPLGSIAPAKSFELRLSAMEGGKAKSADVLLDKPGIIGLGCHLHGSMRGHLFVTDTPYFGKTDATGVATVDNVPEGSADLRLWHPEQLTDQAAQPVQVAATAPVKATAQLNFSPKPRRGS